MFNTIIKISDDRIKREEFANNSYNIGSIFDKNYQIKKMGILIDNVVEGFNNKT